MKKFALPGIIPVIAIVAAAGVFGMFYSIDEGQRGVVTRYGKIVKVAEPGLGVKVPLFDDVTKISVQDHVAIHQNMEAYSRDQQPATMSISVTYRLLADSMGDIYKTYGDRAGLVDRLITRKVMEETKTIFGSFNAESSIRERARLNAEIREAIQKSVAGPVLVLGVQIEDISFSDAYERSVEERMLAEVAVQREHQNLEKEKIQANIVREQARAQADAITMKGEAEANAIAARAQALGNSPNLVELTKAERWDGKLPTTMLPNDTVPFFNTRPSE